MNIREYVEGLGLRDGESYRGNCPECRGKKTFTAYNDYGTLKYNCFKLVCKVGGTYNTDMTAAEIMMRLSPRQEEPEKEVETMEIPAYMVQPNTEHAEFHRFVKRWGLPTSDLMYDLVQQRVVFPIRHKGRIIDAVGRAVGIRQQPKWYRYTGKAGYYTCGTGSTALIVEDVVSAIVAVQEVPNITAIAILGTSLTPKHMEKISEYDNIIIALDPDAVYKTIEYRREIELWTGINTTAMNVSDDIKYRRPEDITKLKRLTVVGYEE